MHTVKKYSHQLYKSFQPMRKYLTLWIAFLFALTVNAQKQNAASISGEWQTSAKDGKVLIYEKEGKYYGKLVWINTPAKDSNNPDATQRNNDLLGTVILKNLMFNGDDKWENGAVYDPKSGKTYWCTVRLKDAHTLELRGFVGISLLGRTELWTR